MSAILVPCPVAITLELNGKPYRVSAIFSLLKSSNTPAGARWITVHPNGKSEKGVPVLVQESKPGSGVWRVIGGAGGKLNYLKLRGVRSEGQYRQEAAQRQREHREAAKLQRNRDRETGQLEAKQAARKAVKQQVGDRERKFISTVAQSMGWKEEDIAFPEQRYQNATDGARSKALKEHQAELLKRANEAVSTQKKLLLNDAEAREQAFSDLPLTTEDPETISVQDLDPIKPNGATLGYAQKLSEHEKDAKTEAQEIKARETDTDQDAEAQRRTSPDDIRKELEGLREPLPEMDTKKALDAKKAADLLRAQKHLQQTKKQAREVTRKIDQGEQQAFVIEVGGQAVDESVKKDLENELSTAGTRAFLAEVGKLTGDPDKHLGRHIGVGAYNSLNSAALTAAGASLVDRDVVDVLGVAGTAQVMARRLHQDLSSEELADLGEAMGEFHRDTHPASAQKALHEAKVWSDVAAGLEVDATARDGRDLVALQELNRQRADAIDNAQRILGTALGEFEANAALVMALKQGAKDSIEVSLGTISREDAVKRARAIGLERGDYQVNSVGSNRFLTVTGKGMDRLAQPVDRESLLHTRKAVAIMDGKEDEDNWLPQGMANRPDLAAHVPPGVAPRLSEPFNGSDEPGQAMRDYIGGRTADGDTPSDIVADLLSEDIASKYEDQASYFTALDKLVPLHDGKGKLVRAESHQGAFEKMADAFVRDRYGTERAPLHRQRFAGDDKSVDALHRALSAEPAGVLAFKPVGDLSRKDQGQLRQWFYRNVAKDERSAELQAGLNEHLAKEPEQEVEDMFGVSTNPAWTQWRQDRDDKLAELNAAKLDWGKYSKTMGGPAKAYTAVQDLVRGHVTKAFHEAHNTLNPDTPIQIGRTKLRGNLQHLDAVDTEARDKRLEEHRELVDALRNRVQGRYAGGSVSGKIESAREAQAAMEQSQMSFFGAEPEPEKKNPLAADERHTLGQAAEKQIADMVGKVGTNFKPDQPVQLWQPSMNGRFINQQRAIKLLELNKRMALAQGVGSGKTVVGLGGFSHLHSQGKVQKGVFAVPSIVQGQFSGEALRYLEPGRFNFHINPGASREERIKAYQDPDNHFSVVTHQALRDDLLHLGAKQAGISEKEMSDRLSDMPAGQRKAWAHEVMDSAGIPWDFMMVDEGHDLLNRAGKENSGMANVLDAVSHNTPYYINASADPVKNDASEIFDVLRKMDPKRYNSRDDFMRKYGIDAQASKDGLRRELARHFYPGRIDPGVAAKKTEQTIPLTKAQHSAIEQARHHVAQARLARMRGQVQVDSLKALSPGSFEGIPEEQYEAVAKRLQSALGMVKDSSIRKIINEHPNNAKIEHVSAIAKERNGKPGVVFATSRAAVKHIAERLRKEGHRVVTLTGSDSAAEKDRKKRQFHPESGGAEADIVVASDAAAVGVNLQRGQWLVQYDTPQTAKTHAQRNGRIHRVGQKNNVELIDLIGDHPSERTARARLRDKYDLRGLLTSPLEGLDDTGLASYLQRARLERQVNVS